MKGKETLEKGAKLDAGLSQQCDETFVDGEKYCLMAPKENLEKNVIKIDDKTTILSGDCEAMKKCSTTSRQSAIKEGSKKSKDKEDEESKTRDEDEDNKPSKQSRSAGYGQQEVSFVINFYF